MTSFAFILGVVPLVIATGAGQEMRRSLGVAVFSGMLGVTVFGIFLTPVFFYVIQGLGGTRVFASKTTGTIFSYSICAGLGALVGYSLVQLGLGVLPWPPIIGACAGILMIRAIRQLNPKGRNSNGAAPATPTSGVP